MPRKADDYRAKAEECEKRAKEAPPALRGEFLRTAQQWRDLAADAEAIAGIRRQLKDQC
jgi:hypothetical protein